tara:strand:- start:1 stop:318 length:318 start_codon:yes stop_codon:yes gene_type:complete
MSITSQWPQNLGARKANSKRGWVTEWLLAWMGLVAAPPAPLTGRNAHSQRIQFYKSLCITLLVGTAIILKCCNRFIVQGIFGATAQHGNVSFVKFQFDLAIDDLL